MYIKNFNKFYVSLLGLLAKIKVEYLFLSA